MSWISMPVRFLRAYLRTSIYHLRPTTPLMAEPGEERLRVLPFALASALIQAVAITMAVPASLYAHFELPTAVAGLRSMLPGPILGFALFAYMYVCALVGLGVCVALGSLCSIAVSRLKGRTRVTLGSVFRLVGVYIGCYTLPVLLFCATLFFLLRIPVGAEVYGIPLRARQIAAMPFGLYALVWLVFKLSAMTQTSKWLGGLSVVVILALLSFWPLRRLAPIDTYLVRSTSMEPCLHVGDMLVGNRIVPAFGLRKTGEIVAFRQGGVILVKRVIARGGERVEVRGKTTLIDGKPLQEAYAHFDPARESSFGVTCNGLPFCGPLQVPPSQLFVMGDNRLNSLDSRMFGTIPDSKVVASIYGVVSPPGNGSQNCVSP